MIRTRKNILLILFVLFFSAPIFAETEHWVVRTFAGMEPLGRISGAGMGSAGSELLVDTGYGLSPGLEAYRRLGGRVEVGAGFRWQALRGAFRSGGSSDERFGYIPVYIAGRFIVTEMDDFRLYGTAKGGFGFFRTTSAFNNILEAPDGPIVSVSGGLYLAAGAGIIYTLKDRPKWGLDLSLDAGYAFYGSKGKDSNGATHAFRYQAMTADFALDWRF